MVVKSHGLLAENFRPRKASRAVQSDGLRIKDTHCNCRQDSSGRWDEMSEVKQWGGENKRLSPLPSPFFPFRRSVLSGLEAALPWWAVQFALLSSLTLMQISSRNTLTNTVRNNFSFMFFTLGICPMVSYLLLPSSYRPQLRNLFFFLNVGSVNSVKFTYKTSYSACPCLTDQTGKKLCILRVFRFSKGY